MASDYASLDTELLYLDKTLVVFGDAKKVIDDIAKTWIKPWLPRPLGRSPWQLVATEMLITRLEFDTFR
ncbi:hypothetical protein SB5_00060 [Pseudomonas oryzihabitans]|nr:hypothetical protein SB5_00060 [Pseudomonas psychrotolerans]